MALQRSQRKRGSVRRSPASSSSATSSRSSKSSSSARSATLSKSSTSARSGTSSKASTSARSREANHARQRETITRLAEGIFAQRGFRGTTIRLVASRARCSVGQIYKLFPSKYDLYRGILETRGENLTALVDTIIDEPVGVRLRIERVVRALLEFFQENSAFFRIFARETGPGVWSSALHSKTSRMARLRRHGLEQVTALMREGQERGELRADLDPAKATTVLFGMIKGQVGEQILFRGEGRLVDDADLIIEVFFRGMAGGSRA